MNAEKLRKHLKIAFQRGEEAVEKGGAYPRSLCRFVRQMEKRERKSERSPLLEAYQAIMDQWDEWGDEPEEIQACESIYELDSEHECFRQKQFVDSAISMHFTGARKQQRAKTN